jgi:hypothetical protein
MREEKLKKFAGRKPVPWVSGGKREGWSWGGAGGGG